ncbi:hypothetical protein SPD48_07120 [Pseudogracilibacillus sp. SE30717A]|uniref:hypothetical protein n=1 Tax=Pseudogracilibacillus sp. SE30717A TaxID=3098293 RepID=UPI00300E3106
MEYEDQYDGTRMIYRTHNDTEVVAIEVTIECPHCGHSWQGDQRVVYGETYEITCGEEHALLDQGCKKNLNAL